jgi:hypothetical protein
MVVDYSITIGNIIEILSIVLGGFAVFMTLKNNVANLKVDVIEMQVDIRKLSDILIKMADMRGELRVIDSRLSGAEHDIREMRHGKGFVRGDRE